MRAHLLAATALSTTVGFLVPGIALAQSVHDWSGFYVGLGAGAVNSQASIDFTGLSSPIVPSTVQLPTLGADGSIKFGYNWQSGQFVYGLENDLSVVTLQGTHSGPNYTVTDSLNTLLSMRARFGVSFDRMMVFATTGVAAGGASFDSNVTDFGKGTPAQARGTVIGGVIGGGIEMAVNDNVSISATGTYYGLSPLHAVGDVGKGPPDDYTATYSPHGTVFEAGVNVHF